MTVSTTRKLKTEPQKQEVSFLSLISPPKLRENGKTIVEIELPLINYSLIDFCFQRFPYNRSNKLIIESKDISNIDIWKFDDDDIFISLISALVYYLHINHFVFSSNEITKSSYISK